MGKYHLPDGETLVTELQCLVVYTPADPAYRQALWGAISQLTKFWMWEPDGAGGEHDAADSWDIAYAATLESFNMLQQLLDAVDEVEDLLRALQTIQNAGAPCCDHLAPANELHAFDDTTYPDNPPATWGDGEPIADASDWEQLVCGAAHAYVDHLKAMADQLESVIDAGAVVVGTIAGLLGLLTGAGIILAVGYGTAAALTTSLLADGTSELFEQVPADIEAARQDIVCAIVHQSSAAVASAVQNAISPLAWTTFYSWVDYASARNVMLEGSHGSEFLGVNRRTDCDCDLVQFGEWEVTAESPAGVPTITNVGTHSWRYEYARGDSQADERSLTLPIYLNTTGCLAHATASIDFTFRATGTWASGNNSGGDIPAFEKRAVTVNCPASAYNPSDTLQTATAQRDSAIDVTMSGTLTPNTDSKGALIMAQLGDGTFANAIDITITLESVTINPA